MNISMEYVDRSLLDQRQAGAHDSDYPGEILKIKKWIVIPVYVYIEMNSCSKI